MQYRLSTQDLALVLALSRHKGLARAGSELELDASTIFRQLKKIEKNLGQRLFGRQRGGYVPTELAMQLLLHAEAIEDRLSQARQAAQAAPEDAAGVVRITATDAVLNYLVIPA